MWERLTRKNIRRFSEDFEEKRKFTGDEKILMDEGYFAYLSNLGIDPNIKTKIRFFNEDGQAPGYEILSDESIKEEQLSKGAVTSRQLAIASVESYHLAASTFSYIIDLLAELKAEIELESYTKEREPLDEARGYHVIPVDFDWMNIPLTHSDCIWEIRFTFDIKATTVVIPDNVTLKFEGGSINNGEIVINPTIDVKDFNGTVILTGDSMNQGVLYPTTNLVVGQMFFDTHIQKPMYYNGEYWFDPNPVVELKDGEI